MQRCSCSNLRDHIIIQRGNDLGVSYNLFMLVSRSKQTYFLRQGTIDIYGGKMFLLEADLQESAWLASFQSQSVIRTRDGALTRDMNDRKSHGDFPHHYRQSKQF